MERVALISAAGLGGIAAGYAAGTGRGITFLVAILVAGLALLTLLRPQVSVHLAIILAFTALPSGLIPAVIAIGPIGVQPYEPFLLVAALHAATQRPPGLKPAGVLGAMFMALAVLGLVYGNPISMVIRDLRPGLSVALAMVVGAGMVHDPLRFPPVQKTITVVLWISAGLTIIASISDLVITGRSETASLEYGAVTTAVRLLTSATWLAVACILACGALIVIGRGGAKSYAGVLIPAIPIVALGFSRNHLLGLTVALIAAVMLSRSGRTLANMVPRVLIAALFLAPVIVALGIVLSTLSPDNWLRVQTDAYSDRVLGGISSSARAEDGSAQFRVEENEAMMTRIPDKPIVGYGLGATYKAPVGTPGTFLYDQAPFYAHNYYLWLALKGGLLSLLAFVVISLRALRNARVGSAAGVAAGATLAGFLAINFFAPMPNGVPTALLFGAAVGAAGAVRLESTANGRELMQAAASRS